MPAEGSWWWWKIYRIDLDKWFYFKQFKNVQTYVDSMHEPYEVWCRNPELKTIPWMLAFKYEPSDYCQCGRTYRDPVKDVEFRFRDAFLDGPSNTRGRIEWLRLPTLCKYCYYLKELNKGHWAPKDVRKELGFPVDD